MLFCMHAELVSLRVLPASIGGVIDAGGVQMLEQDILSTVSRGRLSGLPWWIRSPVGPLVSLGTLASQGPTLQFLETFSLVANQQPSRACARDQTTHL